MEVDKGTCIGYSCLRDLYRLHFCVRGDLEDTEVGCASMLAVGGTASVLSQCMSTYRFKGVY